VVKFDEEYDVVVIGSGAAGLTAAVLAHDHGAKVAVLERTDKLGGTTAVSGGALWIPMNDTLAEAGIEESRDEALAYCKSMAAGLSPDDVIETFVDTGHQMVRYLVESTPAQFTRWTIPDYHMEMEGARGHGRSIEAALFQSAELGAWQSRLRESPTRPPLTLQESIFEHQGHVKPQNLPQALIDEREAGGVVAGGRALAGRLLKGCLDRGITFEMEARAVALVRENGRIGGVRAERGGQDVAFGARRVVLASGGFEWNDQLKRRFLAGPVTHQNSPPANEGDGLIMAAEAGAALGNMTQIWGSPSASVPGETYDGQPLYRIVVPERMCPHTILVNRAGRRFANEGASYNDLGKVFNQFDPVRYEYANVPCWAIFDRQYRERYSVLTVLPDDPDPDWLMRADSLESLAEKVGIDAEGLAATVARWNEASKQGVDTEFGRHRSPVDMEAAHPSMGTIERPPYYALPVHPGTLGTKGGPITNTKGQVLDERGAVIDGLYAAGNVMAGTSGAGYYGGGATIGLAMTWGYICGINAGRPG
jgi:3-oxosteroid 1-dehydrogenase